MLQSMGWQRIGPDLATKQQQSLSDWVPGEAGYEVEIRSKRIWGRTQHPYLWRGKGGSGHEELSCGEAATSDITWLCGELCKRATV